MMYKHKNLKQLFCCVLLLCLFCGSSLGFFSVKADTINQPSRSTEGYGNFGNNVGYALQVNQSAWNLYAANVDTEYMYSFVQSVIQSGAYSATHSQTTGAENGVFKNFTYNSGGGVLHKSETETSRYMIYKRNVIVYFQIRNQNAVPMRISNPYFTVSLRGNKHSYCNVNILSQENLYFNTFVPMQSDGVWNSDLAFRLDSSHAIGNDFYIKGSETLYCSMEFEQYTYTTTDALPPNDYISSVVISSTHTTYTTDVTNDQLLSFDNRILYNSNSQTQQLITDQTDQQKEQYDAFSANTDSSDSNNINSAITGGTDAVKQKMGLFSFFDGIVSDLSDTLTSDHERNLVLPALDVPLPEETVHIWDRKEFDFDELENNFGAILTVVRFATVAVCYVTMINGAYHLFHKFIGVKDSDA